MADAGFWSNQEQAQQVVIEVKDLKAWVDTYDKLVARAAGARELDELLEGDPDPAMIAELDREVESIEADVAGLELRSLMRGRDDFRDAQV